MDFGLARRDEGEMSLTLEGQVLGTPAYMSPELASGRGHHVDGRSDLFSLGVVLYELLTGELPFQGNYRVVLRQILEVDPRNVRRLNEQIPRDLETIVNKCLEKLRYRKRGKRMAFFQSLIGLEEHVLNFETTKLLLLMCVDKMGRSMIHTHTHTRSSSPRSPHTCVTSSVRVIRPS